ncbi:MAG: Fe-S protein assembly co-chaperone HscB [Bryobacterales bacterium]|nr:Fe-S protein assembly co-chaperone HscB [Bryobacterales bacterium]
MHQTNSRNGHASSDAVFPPEIRAQAESATPDFYAFFGYPETLDIDLDDLQEAFYARSRQLHPDRFARASAEDRDLSLRASSLLNDAYRTLRDPLKRAEYVLARHGFDVGQQRSSNVPPELLEEVFELNMALEELRSGDEDARGALEDARTNFVAMRTEIDEGLGGAFARWDVARRNRPGEDTAVSRAMLAEIRGSLNRRRYIQNLLRDVEAALAGQTA